MQQTQLIRAKIQEALSVEQETGHLADVLREVARARGAQLSQAQLDELMQFVRNYVEHVPALLDVFEAAAGKAGVFHQLRPMLDATKQYFLAPVDVIPDHFGLRGLVDDAYLAQSVMQALSDAFRQQTGHGLLPGDLTAANGFIRSLIGEPHASVLDVGVQGALNTTSIQQALMQLAQLAPGFQVSGPDPIWGNASIDEIVNARLGAMGVV